VKTVIRIGQVLDTPEALAAQKFSAFGIRTLADSFAALRDDHPEAVLFVEHDAKKRPVYITVGPNPPELLAGDRQVHAVFSPPDSQEPMATFFAKEDAIAWASTLDEDYAIRAIDSTDRMGVQASVAVIVVRGSDALYCRLKRGKLWTLPEGRIEVGESVESAGRRAVKNLLGLDLGAVKGSTNVPYVNTFMEHAAQHFLTCVLVGEHTGGTPTVRDPHGVIDHCEWFPLKDPPGPLFPTVQGIIRIAKSAPPPETNVQEPPARPVAEAPSQPLQKSAREQAEDYIAEATAPARAPFLVAGTPRSGTQYTTALLQTAFGTHETDVCHEKVGSIGCVSWCHIDPVVGRKFWDETRGRRTGTFSYECKEWSAVVHQVRHPLKVIASMPTIESDFIANGGWPLTKRALDTDAKRHDYLGDDLEWPDDLSSIEAWCAFVLRWNRYIESIASFRFRIEDLHDGEESVWPELLDRLGLKPVPFPAGEFPRDARPHRVLSWRDIKHYAPMYYEPLLQMTRDYGYLR
jgi:8-oxo-dGTP pyrophosphatase MutT (NUDIX family)